jgi:hypothetical protein
MGDGVVTAGTDVGAGLEPTDIRPSTKVIVARTRIAAVTRKIRKARPVFSTGLEAMKTGLLVMTNSFGLWSGPDCDPVHPYGA